MERRNALSPLEQQVMDVVWRLAPCTSEEVRLELAEDRDLKESTVRTLLRRIEGKGFVRHRVEGRTYVYEPLLGPQKAAARAVREIVDRFCQGSMEALFLGMVEDQMVDGNELAELLERVREAEEGDV